MEATNQQFRPAPVPITIARQSPELLKVYADNSDKKSMIIYWSIFLSVIIIALSLTATVPQAIEHRPAAYCANPIGFDNQSQVLCGQSTNSTILGLVIQNLQHLNQFLLMNLQTYVYNATASYNLQQTYNISLYSLKLSNGVYTKGYTYLQKQPSSIPISASGSMLVYNSDNSIKYFDNSVLYLREIDYKNYLFLIQVPTSIYLNQVYQLAIYATIINKQFSVFGITIRYVFFVILICTAVLFLVRLYKLKREEFVLEQKMIVGLSLLGILFNDPFYIITITKPNMVNNLFSVMFLVNLVVYLVIFWITILDKIKDQDQVQQLNSAFTLSKGIYGGCLWICCFVYYLLYSYASVGNQPLMQIQDFNAGAMGYLFIILILMYIGVLAYLIGQHIRIFMKLNEKIWRNQIFVIFSIFFIVVTNVMFMQGFNVHEYIGKRVLVLYVEVNLYIVYMQYMYCPTQETIDTSLSNQARAGETFQLMSNIEDVKEVEIDMPEAYNQIQDEIASTQLDRTDKQQLEVIPQIKNSQIEEQEVINFE